MKLFTEEEIKALRILAAHGILNRDYMLYIENLKEVEVTEEEFERIKEHNIWKYILPFKEAIRQLKMLFITYEVS